MIPFLQTVGPWIVFGGLFYFMMRHGGCGMGHAHGGQESGDHRDGSAQSSAHTDTVVDTTASEVRIVDLERQIAALRNPGSSATEASSAAQPAHVGGHSGCH